MRIFMSVIEGHPISEMDRQVVMPSWKNYNVEFFNAVTPKDLAYKKALRFAPNRVTLKNKRPFTETEKAVWYSHYELWCQCARSRESMLIIEHDSKLVNPLPDLSKYDRKFLSFVYDDVKGPVLAPGSGYFLTPRIAAQAAGYAVCDQIYGNSDGHLAHFLNAAVDKRKKDFQYIEQISIDGLNTIDHHNPKKQFVGPDYENFDLPSVYGETIASL